MLVKPSLSELQAVSLGLVELGKLGSFVLDNLIQEDLFFQLNHTMEL